MLTDGASRPYKWDLKDGAGIQGATITYRGLRPSEGIKFVFKFWTRDQIVEFYRDFLPLLTYDATKKAPKPISVLHPILAANDIFDLVTKEVGELTHEGQQLWSVAVEFIEYRPANKKNVTTTPKDSDTNKDETGDKPTVQDAQDIEIESLTNESLRPI
jgi:hypothetical protein